MRIPNYTQQELCDAVYKSVIDSSEPLTRLEICRAIDRKKSPHIVGMIRDLVSGGWLREIAGKDKHGRPAFKYAVGKKPNLKKACPDEKIDIPA